LTDLAARGSGPLLLAVLLLAGGCAGVADFTGTASQQDLVQLRTDVTLLQQGVQRSRAETDALVDRKLRERTAESERQAAAVTARLDRLAATVTALTTRIEELSSRVDALGRPPGTAAPVRPPAPVAAPPPAPVPGPSAAAPPPAVPGSALPQTPTPAAPPVAPPAVPLRPTTGSLQPQDIYQAAYIDFSKGSYSLAIAGFREFLRRYPEHELANNAQYWIGESYFSLARGYANAGQGERSAQALEQAVQEFKRVVVNYPRGDKAPTALYKEALALIDLKQPGLAQQRLQYLVENFPQAAETPLARERLASLKSN
jgi:tol-pal system protein YbgF